MATRSFFTFRPSVYHSGRFAYFKQPRGLRLSGQAQSRGFLPHRGVYTFPPISMIKKKEIKAAPVAAEEPTSKRPVKVVLIEDVAASIFSREHSVKGKLMTFYNVSFSRSYQDSSGVRKYAKTFDLDDLGKVVAVAQQADEFIRSLLDAAHEGQ
jgi:hypothetical protein